MPDAFEGERICGDAAEWEDARLVAPASDGPGPDDQAARCPQPETAR